MCLGISLWQIICGLIYWQGRQTLNNHSKYDGGTKSRCTKSRYGGTEQDPELIWVSKGIHSRERWALRGTSQIWGKWGEGRAQPVFEGTGGSPKEEQDTLEDLNQGQVGQVYGVREGWDGAQARPFWVEKFLCWYLCPSSRAWGPGQWFWT